MKTRILRIAAPFALGAALAAGVVQAPALARPLMPAVTPRTLMASEAMQVFQATNASRGRFNLSALKANRAMSEVAQRHSQAMADAGGLFHTSNVDVYLHGVSWHVWGENVGYTAGDVGGLQQAFMNSPEHRHNILNASFTRVAVGAVRKNGTLWVTVFFYG